MLDGLLGRGGFSSKCKSLIKPTKTRIEVLRRRAEAKQRFLKEDLVKLLSNGLDVNAYGRTEEFLAGMSLLSCYSFLEQACDYIYKQLSVMQKLRECPEECREPVASLMFAAARFSDLPELRDLRDEFQDRYGNSLECFANQVFVEKLASKPPTMEKRLQILLDIASEFSIKWDSKAFQQRMANPSVQAQDKSIKHGPSAVIDGKYKLPNSKNSQVDKLNVRSKERIEHANRGPTLDNVKENAVLKRDELKIPFVGKQDIAGRTPRPITVKAETSLKGENREIPFRGRPDSIPEKHGSSNGKDDITLKTQTSGSSSSSRKQEYFLDHMVYADQKRENMNIASSARPIVDSNGDGDCNDTLSQRKPVKSTEKLKEEGTDKFKSSHSNALPPPYVKLKDNPIPPPYVKSNENGYGAHHRSKHTRLEADGSSVDLSHRIETKPSVSTDSVSKNPGCTYFKEDGPVKNHDYRHHGHHKESTHEVFGSDGSSMDPSHRIQTNVNLDRVSKRSDHTHFKEDDPEKDRDYRSHRGHKGSKHAGFGFDGSSMDPSPQVQTKPALRLDRVPKSPDHTYLEDGSENDRDYRSHGGHKGSKHAGFGSDRYSMDPSAQVQTNPASRLDRVPKSPDHTYFKEDGSEKVRDYRRHGGHKGSKHAGFGSDGSSMDPSLPTKDRVPKEPDNFYNDELNHAEYHNDWNNIPLPKPRSIRRKHAKSSSSHDDVGSSEDPRIVKRIASSKRKEAKGLQILFDDDHKKKDDEEKMMDKLLLHYSNKSSNCDPEMLRKKPQSSDSGRDPHTRIGDRPNETPEIVIPPHRSLSLPNEQSGESETQQKVFTRANSFQPDNQAKHVHPKLPDYDDLAARFAALKGR